MLLPADFIELAGEEELLGGIGSWVYAEAAARSLAWSRVAGAPFQISVNKSRVQFLHEDVDWAEHSRKMGLVESNLAVELAEDVLLDAPSSLRRSLDRLREAGVEVGIDEFGAGCSSVAHLKRFGIDYLKIDHSFAQAHAADAGGRVIVEAMIAMAHGLGLKTVAKRVETSEQKAWLASAGCDYARRSGPAGRLRAAGGISERLH